MILAKVDSPVLVATSFGVGLQLAALKFHALNAKAKFKLSPRKVAELG